MNRRNFLSRALAVIAVGPLARFAPYTPFTGYVRVRYRYVAVDEGRLLGFGSWSYPQELNRMK